MIRIWLLPSAVWECISILYTSWRMHKFCTSQNKAGKCKYFLVGCEVCIKGESKSV